MKPELYEISDDEWENHSFKPSRVLKRPRSPPPPLESFAYKPPPQTVSSSDDDDCVEINGTTANTSECLDDLEDADVDDSRGVPFATTRRRFIIDDDEDEFGGGNENGDTVDLFEIDSTEDEIEIEEENEDDLVGRALQKCVRISVELKGELFGTSGFACDVIEDESVEGDANWFSLCLLAAVGELNRRLLNGCR